MSEKTNTFKEQSLFQITWPLFIELSLHMGIGIIATLILSDYSDNAVAGVGVANQILNIAILVFSVTSVGATILIGQSIGANNFERARRLSRSAVGVNFWVGIAITAIVCIFGESFLAFYGLSGEVLKYATTFLIISGLSLVFESISLALGAVLRSHGYTKQTMYVTIMMNVISLIGNLIAVKGFFGLFPITGVEGVAVSTIVARIFVVIALLYFVYKILSLKLHAKDMVKINGQDVRDLMGIGIPSAGENFSYQFSQIVITSFVALMGDASLTARVYILNISMLCFLFTLAVAQGTQILISRYMGAKQYDRALKRGIKTLKMAMFTSLFVSLLFAFIGKDVLDMFTDDPAIIAVALPVLWAIVFIEPGRAMNMVLMGSLKSVGDVRFPVVIGIISMWGIAAVFSYVFGIYMGLGLLGVWLAQGFDEWFRGLFALKRWLSKPWERKLVQNKANVEPGA